MNSPFSEEEKAVKSGHKIKNILEDDLSSIISYYLEEKEESEESKKVISDYLDTHE